LAIRLSHLAGEALTYHGLAGCASRRRISNPPHPRKSPATRWKTEDRRRGDFHPPPGAPGAHRNRLAIWSAICPQRFRAPSPCPTPKTV